MTYVYRGKLHDAAPKPESDQPDFDDSACGTYKGYRRHMRSGVEQCEPCRAANAAYMKRWRAANPQPKNPRPLGINDPARCGTRTGYNRHRMQGTLTCQPCRDANAAYSRKRKEARAAA